MMNNLQHYRDAYPMDYVFPAYLRCPQLLIFVSSFFVHCLFAQNRLFNRKIVTNQAFETATL